jgi:hypothetical protein
MTMPVAVWDTRNPNWRYRREEKSRWLREQGLPADEMFRAEFPLDGAPYARIFCYALNEDGRRYMDGHSQDPHDHAACTAAAEPPRIVPLNGLPPRELLGG